MNETHLTLDLFCEMFIEEIKEHFPRIYTQKQYLMFTHMKMAQTHYEIALISNKGIVTNNDLQEAIRCEIRHLE